MGLVTGTEAQSRIKMSGAEAAALPTTDGPAAPESSRPRAHSQRGNVAMKVIARIRGLTEWEEGETEILTPDEDDPTAVRPYILCSDGQSKSLTDHKGYGCR